MSSSTGRPSVCRLAPSKTPGDRSRDVGRREPWNFCDGIWDMTIKTLNITTKIQNVNDINYLRCLLLDSPSGASPGPGFKPGAWRFSLSHSLSLSLPVKFGVHQKQSAVAQMACGTACSQRSHHGAFACLPVSGLRKPSKATTSTGPRKPSM